MTCIKNASSNKDAIRGHLSPSHRVVECPHGSEQIQCPKHLDRLS